MLEAYLSTDDKGRLRSNVARPPRGFDAASLRQFEARISYLAHARAKADERTRARIDAQIEVEKAAREAEKQMFHGQFSSGAGQFRSEQRRSIYEKARELATKDAQEKLQRDLERVEERGRLHTAGNIVEHDNRPLHKLSGVELEERIKKSVREVREQSWRFDARRKSAERDASSDNQIKGKEPRFPAARKRRERAVEAQQLEGFRAQHVVDKSAVEYLKDSDSTQAFVDRGKSIDIAKGKELDRETLRASIRLAAAKFEKGFKLRGTKEEQEALAKEAVEMGLGDRIKNENLRQFVREQQKQFSLEKERERALEKGASVEKSATAEQTVQAAPTAPTDTNMAARSSSSLPPEMLAQIQREAARSKALSDETVHRERERTEQRQRESYRGEEAER